MYKRQVSDKPNVFTDKNDNPMDVLGIGANMVKSLRYWLQAVGLTKEPKTGRKDQMWRRDRLSRVIYMLVGLSGLYLISFFWQLNRKE